MAAEIWKILNFFIDHKKVVLRTQGVPNLPEIALTFFDKFQHGSRNSKKNFNFPEAIKD